MNTLAESQHPTSALATNEGEPCGTRAILRTKPDQQGSLFILGSVVLHVVIILAFSKMPASAFAAPDPERLVEIALLDDATSPAVEPEAPTPLPLGSLDTIAKASRAPSTVATAVPDSSTPPDGDSRGDAHPQILAADNPYASSNAAVFTSGTAATAGPATRNSVGPVFGVKSGAADAPSDRTAELGAWYGKVQAQLARLGASSYPRRALKLGQQGTSKVTVTIDAEGNLIAARISSGSGVSSLDEAALSTLRAVGKVAPPPDGAGTNSLTVPIVFRIPG